MKNTGKLILISAMALSISACGATTGGLKGAIAQKVASEAVRSAVTENEPVAVTTVTTETVYVENNDPKCAAIQTKMMAVDQRILEANETLGTNGTNVVGGVATAAATQGAMHAGAAQVIGKVPFGGLFAKAAMDKVGNSGKKKQAKAQKSLQKASLEKAKLEGMYAGKGCS